jgi:hypothetical protein
LCAKLVHGLLLRATNISHCSVNDLLLIWVHKLADVWALQGGVICPRRLLKHVPAGLLRLLWVCRTCHVISFRLYCPQQGQALFAAQKRLLAARLLLGR